MQLAWIRYQHEAKHKYVLMLLLGEQEDFRIGIFNDNISHAEAQILRKYNKALDDLDLNSRLAWIKQNLPMVFRNALRKIRKDRSQIVRKYLIKPFDTRQTDQVDLSQPQTFA